MKKRFAALFLALAMVGSLAACGSKPAESAPAASAPAASAPAASTPAESGEFKPSNKTLTLIVPYAAGGAVDLGARLMAKYAANYTDIDIVITNVTGGSGTVGAAEMLKYANDGTYMLAYNPSPGNVATADKPLTYDCTVDLAPVAMMVQDQRLIICRSDETRFTDLPSMIEYAKSNSLNLGCSGTGNAAYYTPLMLADAAGVELTVVAFDGSAEAKTALMGGHIDLASASYSDIAADPSQFTVLCNAGDARFEKLPDIPTMKECGYDVEMYVSRGFAMKAGTDEQIIKYWSDIIGKVCQDPDFLKEADGLGLPIRYMDYVEFTEDNLAEMANYKTLVESGI